MRRKPWWILPLFLAGGAVVFAAGAVTFSGPRPVVAAAAADEPAPALPVLQIPFSAPLPLLNAAQDGGAQDGAAAGAAAQSAPRPPLRADAEPEQPAGEPFDFEKAVERARQLAAEDYAAPEPAPAAARDLDYDEYRRIEFRRDAADWSDDPASMLHVHYGSRGFLFNDAIKVNIIEDGLARPRPYAPEDFNFFDLPLGEEDKAALGFAGLHLTTTLNAAGKYDDVINFKGASFFRALGAGNSYGASARGLALFTASSVGEEFPAFREFWIERPEPGADSFAIYALMDSPSVSGAFRFVVEPGAHTVVDVEAAFFPRRDITEVGVAPLTSMFDFAPQDPAVNRQDFRPRVHDSDGLMIRLRNGEWVWRPLANPQRLEISSFAENTPHGFGLMQRERRFSAYEDLEARYEKRPSIWISPQGDWGKGKLMLVEIPTVNEFNDNIVTFWRPEEPWRAGQEVRLAYRMHWGLEAPVHPNVARVKATRTGVSGGGKRLFVIDFATENEALLEGAVASVTTSAGNISNTTLTRNTIEGGARLSFELDGTGAEAAELRAVLKRADNPVSETWLYRWRSS